MDNTLIQQGYVQATNPVANIYIPVRAGFDWVHVMNYTEWYSASANAGFDFRWQRGMDNGEALALGHNGSSAVINAYLPTGGISFLDSSINTPEAAKTGTTLTKATPPLASVATHGYATGDIVRITSVTTGMEQLQGLDFTITYNNANSFYLANINTNTANFTAATAFTARRIPFNPLYYPRRRVITGFQAALIDTTQTLITMSVTHGYTAGQTVAVTIPSVWGITLPRVECVITAVGQTDSNGFTNTITVNLPSSSWSGTFAWPAATLLPLTYAEVVPVGENVNATIYGATSAGVSTGPLNPNLLDDRTYNTGELILVLGTGSTAALPGPVTLSGPAGTTAGDWIYWMAGKNYLI